MYTLYFFDSLNFQSYHLPTICLVQYNRFQHALPKHWYWFIIIWIMTDIEKSHVEAESSSFEPLPDDVVLQIFRKLDDLKTLCHCKPVSKRFYRIILQVDTISFITKHRNFFSSFLSVIRSLKFFGGLKSLCIQVPLSRVDCPLFKWKVKFRGKLDSFIFLSLNSI